MEDREQAGGAASVTPPKAAVAASWAVGIVSALSALAVIAVLFGGPAGGDALGGRQGRISLLVAAFCGLMMAVMARYRAEAFPRPPRKRVGDLRAAASVLLFFFSCTALDVLFWAAYSSGSLAPFALWLGIWTYQCARQAQGPLATCMAARKSARMG